MALTKTTSETPVVAWSTEWWFGSQKGSLLQLQLRTFFCPVDGGSRFSGATVGTRRPNSRTHIELQTHCREKTKMEPSLF